MDSIQEMFERDVNSQQFSFNKLDLTRYMYMPETYTNTVTQLAFTYYLAGFNAGMKKD
jgi:hypothetical protein